MRTFSGLYLFYVRKYNIVLNDYELVVYKCHTKDALHTMGEMIYRTLEHIKRIDINEWTEEREKYWLEHGYEINEWHDKYKVEDNNE